MATETKKEVDEDVKKPEVKESKNQTSQKKSDRSKVNKDSKTETKIIEVKSPKTILRNKDSPRSKSRVVIKDEANKEHKKEVLKKRIPQNNRNTPVATIETPLRGNPDSPLKPFK